MLDITDIDVDEVITQYLGRDTEEDERHKPKVGVYHASDGSNCLRKRYYSDTGVAKSEFLDGASNGIFERGERIENFVFDSLWWGVETGMFNGENVEVQNSLDVQEEMENFVIVGSTDPYISRNDEVLALCEVKSARGVNSIEEPKFSHRVQLNTYVSILGLDSGVLIYVDPHNYANRKVFDVPQDEDLWEATKLLHKIYHSYREADKLPPRVAFSDDPCNYCSYKVLCSLNKTGEEHIE